MTEKAELRERDCVTGEGVIIRDVRSSIGDKRRWKSVIYACMYVYMYPYTVCIDLCAHEFRC